MISSWASSSWCEISRCECFRAANSRCTTNVVSSSSARDTWPRTSRAASALDSASSNSIVCLSRRFSERSLCQHHHSLCEYLWQWQCYGGGGAKRAITTPIGYVYTINETEFWISIKKTGRQNIKLSWCRYDLMNAFLISLIELKKLCVFILDRNFFSELEPSIPSIPN